MYINFLMIKPRLVEHMFHFSKPVIQKPVIQKPVIQKPVIQKPVIIYQEQDLKPLFINVICILFMIFGGVFLYYRKMRKDIEQKEHINKIYQLNKFINLK